MKAIKQFIEKIRQESGDVQAEIAESFFKDDNKMRIRAAAVISSSTCIILDSESNETKFVGSGVFVKVTDSYFLLTAKHVVKDYFENLSIPISNTKISFIRGDLIVNLKEEPGDKIDFAFWKLEASFVEDIKQKYEFITEQELGINHQSDSHPTYHAIGYPATKVKYNRIADEDRYQIFSYNTVLSDEELYQDFKCNTTNNLIINFDKKNSFNSYNGNKTVPVNPFGMSGGGLWHIPLQPFNNGKIIKSLVGILTEWPIQNRKHMIATRIDFFTEFVRMVYKLPLKESVYADIDIEDNIEQKLHT